MYNLELASDTVPDCFTFSFHLFGKAGHWLAPIAEAKEQGRIGYAPFSRSRYGATHGLPEPFPPSGIAHWAPLWRVLAL